MYALGAVELLLVLVIVAFPGLVVIYIVATLVRGARSRKDMAAQLDRIERKLDEKPEK